MAITPAELAFASWRAAEEKERQRAVVLTRDYYDGNQDTFLTERLKEFLNAKDAYEFNLNLCRTIVGAVEERLILDGPDTTEGADSQPVAEWANDIWNDSQLDLLYDSVHEGTLRDGEYFIMVDWDVEHDRPRFTPHPRYTDAELGGDNFGCKAHYPDDDTNQPMINVSKRWIESLGEGKTRSRMTLYYPDRVEKYQWAGSGWVEFKDEDGGTWPLPWVDGQGQPLGITGIHFRNTPDLRSEIWDAIPIQKAINKGLIDLLANADLTGFQMYIALGWIPTTDGQPLKSDGSNAAVVGPGRLLGTTQDASKVSFQAVPGGDLAPLIDMLQSLIGWMSVITSTPRARLSFSGQVAAEGTLQEQNESLFAKVRKRQRLIDASWRDALSMARRLANVYGSANLDETVKWIMRWEPVQARDTQGEREEWKTKKELGVPLETLWGEMGYDRSQIEEMMGTEEYRSRMALQSAMLGGEAG